MKINKYILLMLTAVFSIGITTSCDKADDADGYQFEYPAPEFDTSTELGTLQKEIYDTYGVYATPKFSDTFYTFDWAYDFDEYTRIDVSESDYSHTVSYMKELKKVLTAMPSFLTERLPSYILLVDSLRNEYEITQSGSDTGTKVVQGMMGSNQTNFIVLAFAGKSFAEQDINEIRESWAELLFERALSDYTAPEEFSALVSSQASGRLTGYELTRNWSTSRSMSKFGFIEDTYLRRNRTVSGTMNRSGKLTALVYSGTMTSVQDMSLFIAFSMFRPTEKKAEIYAISDVFAQKEEAMKSYCSSTLGFELKQIDLD